MPWVCVSRSYRETSEDANNPGNNLYVTGLSMQVSEKELQDHFEQEGKVIKFFVVVYFRVSLSVFNCLSEFVYY